MSCESLLSCVYCFESRSLWRFLECYFCRYDVILLIRGLEVEVGVLFLTLSIGIGVVG